MLMIGRASDSARRLALHGGGPPARGRCRCGTVAACELCRLRRQLSRQPVETLAQLALFDLNTAITQHYAAKFSGNGAKPAGLRAVTRSACGIGKPRHVRLARYCNTSSLCTAQRKTRLKLLLLLLGHTTQDLVHAQSTVLQQKEQPFMPRVPLPQGNAAWTHSQSPCAVRVPASKAASDSYREEMWTRQLTRSGEMCAEVRTVPIDRS